MFCLASQRDGVSYYLGLLFINLFVLTMRSMYQPVYQKNNMSIRTVTEYHFQPFSDFQLSALINYT